MLQGVAVHMAEDLLRAVPDKATIQRAQRVMATSGLMLREAQGFAAIRRVMAASSGLAAQASPSSVPRYGARAYRARRRCVDARHCGARGVVARRRRGRTKTSTTTPKHTTRGAEYLKGLGLPVPVVEAACSRRERWDGSGFPLGLREQQNPEFGHVVGLVNTFDKVYSAQQPRVGVLDALRILAQAYRGCFDDRLAQGFVRLFR